MSELKEIPITSRLQTETAIEMTSRLPTETVVPITSRIPTENVYDSQQASPKRPVKSLISSIAPISVPIETKIINVKPVDTSANVLPFGCITFAMNIVLYSCYLVNFYQFNPILLTELLMVGGVGGITSGTLELIKGRSAFLPSFFYCYGFWSLTVFSIAFFNLDKWITVVEDNDSLLAFTFFWLIISGMIFFGSFRTNVVFVVCSGAMFVMMLLLVVYYGVDKLGVRQTAGVFGIIAGCCGFYIGMGHLLADEFHKEYLPMGVLGENGFDVYTSAKMQQEQQQLTQRSNVTKDAINHTTTNTNTNNK